MEAPVENPMETPMGTSMETPMETSMNPYDILGSLVHVDEFLCSLMRSDEILTNPLMFWHAVKSEDFRRGSIRFYDI